MRAQLALWIRQTAPSALIMITSGKPPQVTSTTSRRTLMAADTVSSNHTRLASPGSYFPRYDLTTAPCPANADRRHLRSATERTVATVDACGDSFEEGSSVTNRGRWGGDHVM